MSKPFRAAGFSPRDVANEMVPRHASPYRPPMGTPHGSGKPLALVHRPATAVLRPSVPSSFAPFVPSAVPAFSLLELMIGIVILGLGLVMVATVFPVAWERARTLSEYTTERAVVDNAHATVASLVHVSSPPTPGSSFFGDWIYDPSSRQAIDPCGFVIADTRVHALNAENLRLSDRRLIPEHTWEAEAPGFANDLLLFLAELDPQLVKTFDDSFFYLTQQDRDREGHQVSFHQRLYPPMPTSAREGSGLRAATWEAELDSRRFCWAALHRLRQPLEFQFPRTLGATRTFDVYYVTLRRPQPTYRYARQDPASAPNPCDLMQSPVTPAARPASEDVLLPVPWRVQVQFPATLEPKINPETNGSNVTGIPTEVLVPPPNSSAGLETKIMLVEMFPAGAQFIDEINGQVYRVVKRRLTGASGDQAVLTLDREVFVEDVDLPANDPRCDVCETVQQKIATGADPTADAPELLRTVWIFPPPVAAAGGRAGQTRQALAFAGSQPVVGIDVRTLNVAPSR